MKKYTYSFLLVINVVFLSCSSNNEPQISWNETGYRLDSTISFYNGTINSKSVYYYSVSSEYCDSVYMYNRMDNQWMLNELETYKYDEKWRVIEYTYSNRSFDSNMWILNFKDNYSYFDYPDGSYCIQSSHMPYNLGEAIFREEHRDDEYDSLGNCTLSIYESKDLGGNLYSALKYDNFYTENRLDSVYVYKRSDPQMSFAFSYKTIYLQYDEFIKESVEYDQVDNQFIPSSKLLKQYDEHSNLILQDSYRWKDDTWSPMHHYEISYLYIPNTDLIKEMHYLLSSYNAERVSNNDIKIEYYYTKL